VGFFFLLYLAGIGTQVGWRSWWRKPAKRAAPARKP
jgi:hypothetical protein